MKHPSHTLWRKALEKRIERKLPDYLWEKILKEEKVYIETTNPELEPEGVNALVALALNLICGEMANLRQSPWLAPSLAAAKTTPQKVPAPIELLSYKKQIEPLSRVIALRLSKEKEVQNFRNDILGGRLLSPEEVLPWIRSVAKEEGRETPHKLGTLWVYFWPYNNLRYPIQFKAEGVLCRLAGLAEQQKDFWPEPAAIHFILTGQHYPVHRYITEYKIDGHYQIPWVSLRVHPSLSGDEVRTLYLEERNRLNKNWPGFTSPKGLTEKHLALAVFAVKQSGSLASRLPEWNNVHPGWPYADSASARGTFARDCRAAYERLTGWKWREEEE